MDSKGTPTNRIYPGVQTFAWNHDASMIAVCPTNNEIWVFQSQGSPDISKWTKIQTLKEHFNVITSLAWHPITHLLISVSADRGVIVWKQEDGEFKPQLGMCKENRANLDAAWNTRGDKFVVASSSGCVYVGTYFEANNFWVAHTVSKSSNKPIHKASAICAKFDPPSSRVVISSSLDGTVQITSCYNKELDKDGSGPFAGITTYGECLLSVSSNGWVNHAAFSPNGTQICFVTHDCEVNFANVENCGKDAKAKTTPEKIMHNGNPHLNCMFLAEDKCIATGYDKVPYLYAKKADKWEMSQILDKGFSNTRKTKISSNHFKDKKVYFNSDFKLDSKVEMKEADT